MKRSYTAYIGVGTNLGDKVQNIINARTRLLQHKLISRCLSSSLYLSSPVGYSEQGDFLNCVFQLSVECNVDCLFTEAQRIETELGRVRDLNNQNAPRVIDLDILLFDDYVSNDPELTIPHPRIAERLFVLQPLLELEPGLMVPGLGTVLDLLNSGHKQRVFQNQTIYKLGA